MLIYMFLIFKCFVCIYIHLCTTCTTGKQGGQKRVSDPLEQRATDYQVGVGNRTWSLWKCTQNSQHLFNPKHFPFISEKTGSQTCDWVQSLSRVEGGKICKYFIKKRDYMGCTCSSVFMYLFDMHRALCSVPRMEGKQRMTHKSVYGYLGLCWFLKELFSISNPPIRLGKENKVNS